MQVEVTQLNASRLVQDEAFWDKALGFALSWELRMWYVVDVKSRGGSRGPSLGVLWLDRLTSRLVLLQRGYSR